MQICDVLVAVAVVFAKAPLRNDDADGNDDATKQ